MTDNFMGLKSILAIIGGVIGFFIGEANTLLFALIALMIVDYITGVSVAISKHELSSEIGAKGICKKIIIMCLVGVANIIDVAIIKEGASMRTMCIFFYLANEGISILENAVVLGLPVPEVLRRVLMQIHDKGNGEVDEGTQAEQHTTIK